MVAHPTMVEDLGYGTKINTALTGNFIDKYKRTVLIEDKLIAY